MAIVHFILNYSALPPSMDKAGLQPCICVHIFMATHTQAASIHIKLPVIFQHCNACEVEHGWFTSKQKISLTYSLFYHNSRVPIRIRLANASIFCHAENANDRKRMSFHFTALISVRGKAANHSHTRKQQGSIPAPVLDSCTDERV